MVSVIMPAFQAAKTIGWSIETVLAQTYPDWELIIVAEDRESAEATENFCKIENNSTKRLNERIKVIRNSERLGVAKSRNKGIDEAKGKWLAFLDADDLWKEDKLEKQLALNAPISFTASAFIDATGDNYEYILHVPEKLTRHELLRRNLISCSSVLLLRDIMQPFPEIDKPVHEDYVVWMNILREVDAVGLDEPLLTYRISKDSKSSSRLKSGLMTYNAYLEAGFSHLESAMMTARYAKWSIEKRRMLYKSVSR